MSQRAYRIVALAVLAVLLVGSAGVAVWGWVADYWSYRQFVTSPAQPGGPETSLEEFLLYRRTVAFYDAAERLAERNAGAEEVRSELGEPDQVKKMDDHDVWFYRGPVFRGHQSVTIVLDIDVETSRVTSIGYIHHN